MELRKLYPIMELPELQEDDEENKDKYFDYFEKMLRKDWFKEIIVAIIAQETDSVFTDEDIDDIRSEAIRISKDPRVEWV